MEVIKIGAVWCNGCIVMRPRWQKVEKQNPWLITQYYDYDESPDIVEKYDLDSGKLPTFIFLDKNEQEILRLWGEVSEEELTKLINQYKDV